MTQSILDPEHKESTPQGATGEELATRIFSIVMFCVCAMILVMAVIGDY